MVKYVISCFLLTLVLSCNKTIYSGESKSLLRTDISKDVVVFDYSDLQADESLDRFRFFPGDELGLLHIYCINNDPSDLSKDCIINCGIQLDADLVVVCYNKNLKAGFPAIYRHDAQVRSEDYGVVRPSEETAHIGSLSFDIYNTVQGIKIASFEVTVRISGLTVKDKRGLGYSNVNLTAARSAIRKCRRKGLLNVSNRLID